MQSCKCGGSKQQLLPVRKLVELLEEPSHRVTYHDRAEPPAPIYEYLALYSLRSLCNYGGFVTKVKKAPKPRAMRYANSSVFWLTTIGSSINYTRASVGLVMEVHSRYVFWNDNTLPLGAQKALLSLCLYNHFYGACLYQAKNNLTEKIMFCRCFSGTPSLNQGEPDNFG